MPTKSMGLKKLANNYAQYNAWANSEVVRYLSSVPPFIVSKEVKSSFSTILKTVHHIGVAQEFWLSVLSENNAYQDLNDPEKDNWEQTSTLFINSALALVEHIGTLSEAGLQKEIQTPWIKSKQARYDVLLHCINHSSYHRGQLTNMYRQLDIPPITYVDYYEFIKLKANHKLPDLDIR